MSFSAKYVVDKNRIKKDGTSNLRLRITINRRSFEINSGYCLPSKHWDDKKQVIRKSCPLFQNVARINNILQKRKASYYDKVTKLDEEGKLDKMSLKEIKLFLLDERENTHTIAFFEAIISEMRQAGKVGNARVYDMVKRSVVNFVDNQDFPLKQISFSWLKKYEAWYLGEVNKTGKKNTLNGLSVHLRTIRALCNRAIKQNLLSQDDYAFKSYSIKQEATRKRALSEEDIKKLLDITPETDRERRAKDYFFISFYLMGASFIDIVNLRYQNIINDRIEYKRRKTGNLHSIKISPMLQEILNKYWNNEAKSSDFILPILTVEQSSEEQYRKARQEMKVYNRALKALALKAGIEGTVTSYVSRHSYATIAKFKNVPVSVIAQALGHSDVKTTETYLASFDNETMDKYNELVIK